MPNAVYCNWDTCKHNSDGICKKVACIVLETIEKEGNEFLICKSFESPTKEVQRPLNTQQLICPECGYRLIPEGGCSVCINCGYSPCK